LTAEKYIGGKWDHNKEGKRQSEAIKAIVATSFPVDSVTVELAYWRKSNQIHQWFVDNVQGGKDEYQNSYVTKENLEALLKLVNEVLADHSRAEELLPTAKGFFFGSQDYDEWYFKGLQETKDMIEKILATEDLDDWNMYYHSSW
jgi:hypothetical protein